MTKAKDKPPQEPPRKPSRKSPSAFDVWLQRGLHELYDDVAREPIPDDLLKLIEEDRQDRQK